MLMRYIRFTVRFWICAFTKGFGTACKEAYNIGYEWGARIGKGAVVQPEWCDENGDSEDDLPGLELAPRMVTVRLISATANSPDGNASARKAITVSK
jgi:hypothetical protein